MDRPEDLEEAKGSSDLDEAADAFLRAEMKKWAEVVAATGIKAQ